MIEHRSVERVRCHRRGPVISAAVAGPGLVVAVGVAHAAAAVADPAVLLANPADLSFRHALATVRPPVRPQSFRQVLFCASPCPYDDEPSKRFDDHHEG
jgi:hypothetical protein